MNERGLLSIIFIGLISSEDKYELTMAGSGHAGVGAPTWAVNIRDVYDISLVHLSEFAEVEYYRNFSLKFYQGTCEILTSDMDGGLAIIYTNL